MRGGLSKLALASLIGFEIKILRGGGLLVSIAKPLVCAAAREMFSKSRLGLAFFWLVFLAMKKLQHYF